MDEPNYVPDVTAVVKTVEVDGEWCAELFRFNGKDGANILTITGAGAPFHASNGHVYVGPLDLPGYISSVFRPDGLSYTSWGKAAETDASMPPWRRNRVPVWRVLRAPPSTMNAIADYVRDYYWTPCDGTEDALLSWNLHWPIYH